MELTLNTLLDELESCNPVCYIKNKNRSFRGVTLLTADPSDLDSERLIICRLSLLLSNPAVKQDCCVAAVIDTDLPKNTSILHNVILFDTDMNAVDFFIYVQKIFEKYFDWCARMDEYLIKNRSIQDILSLSEKVIGNYITISDSAFSLVAYTQGLVCDDPLTMNLVSKGYHDQEAISLFSKNNLLDYWRDAVDIYEKNPGGITRYPMLGKVIHYNNSYFAHVVMLCDRKPLTPGLKDLFKILIDHLMVCFERQWIDNNQMPHVYDSLLLEMLSSDNIPPDVINARARNAGIPVKGTFWLVKVSTDDQTGIMLQRLSQELSAKITGSRVTLSKDILIGLVCLKNSTVPESLIKDLQEIMLRYESCCGISDPFDSLSQIKIAGEQASIALTYAKRSTEPEFAIGSSPAIPRVREFGGVYPRYMLTASSEVLHIAASTKASKALKTLADHDARHGTNNLQLLFVYLTNERRASDTAKIMHMHRNNVIYRVGKIADMINMDLSDCGVRFRLLLAYEIYRRKEL